MSRIRSSGTSPESKLATLLAKWFAGAEIRANDQAVFGRPDFHIVELGMAVFVDGCFFHGCPKHHRAPVQNAEYWTAKVKRNKVRDRLVTRTLVDEGFLVVRIWEHDLRGKGVPGRERIRRKLRRAAAKWTEPVSAPLKAAESRAEYSVGEGN